MAILSCHSADDTIRPSFLVEETPPKKLLAGLGMEAGRRACTWPDCLICNESSGQEQNTNNESVKPGKYDPRQRVNPDAEW